LAVGSVVLILSVTRRVPMIPSIALFARSVCDQNHRRQIMSIFSPGIAALDLPLNSRPTLLNRDQNTKPQDLRKQII
jgi:hypothetical protein